MIKLEDVIKAVNGKIEGKFPEIEIMASHDVKEGFKRPSFFTDLEDISKMDSLHYTQRNATIVIYYFPENRYIYKLDILEKMQAIEELFKIGFMVNEKHLNILDDISSDVIDGVLNVRMQIEYSEADNIDEIGEMMQELVSNV